MPSEAVQLFELAPPPLLAALFVLVLLLELLLLPQPAATSAVSARAARLMRTFIGSGTSSSGEFSFGQGRRPRVCRGAVGVIRRRRRAGGPEHRDQAHDVLAGVLQTMNGARRQLEARAGADGAAGAANVKRALAVEDVNDLVVRVEVLGGALGGDVADELGGAAQPR